MAEREARHLARIAELEAENARLISNMRGATFTVDPRDERIKELEAQLTSQRNEALEDAADMADRWNEGIGAAIRAMQEAE